MNRKILSISAGLATLTALVHLIAGTLEIQVPLLGSGLPREITLLLYACWHLVSVVLMLSAVGLVVATLRSTDRSMVPLTRFVGALWTGFGMVFIVIALAFEGPAMLLKLPQWSLLIPTGVLAIFGSRKSRS